MIHGVVSAVSMSSSDMANAAVRRFSARARCHPASSRRPVVPATCRSATVIPYFSRNRSNRALPA